MNKYFIKEVNNARLLNDFIDFPYDLYKDDSNWVPPIKKDYIKLFDKKLNPFFAEGDMQLYLVKKNESVVGRIASIDNHEHNKVHNENIGFFGFFECYNDPEIANLLLKKATKWLLERGRVAIRGPVSPSMNYESGFLVEGFDDAPRLMMPYTKSYYPYLTTDLGFNKVKQLWAYKINSRHVADNSKIARVAESIKLRSGVRLREIQMKNFQEEIYTIVDIFNKCWCNNWGFIPISQEAAIIMAKSMKPIVEKSLILIAEIDDKPVGMIVTLYDYNEILKKMKGRLFPFGFLHLLNAKNKIGWLRMMLIGVLPEYRSKGIDALLYYQSALNALKLNKFHCEGSWTLEDNHVINRLATMMGGKVYKKYNIYEKFITENIRKKK
ncbi:hypothetical protein [Flavivirga jejuensis]|uniref:N-acetyltransferase domain-containing protein n=1 Tax=Flavivirga jejuensis TaxID=870487 RepID=A0ABT8WT64_9FLAO|nr:hypothetical protein [Flavivirga jejuensis]MDO5976353.1 hypothetical protein [Flavivirga jejuensis]